MKIDDLIRILQEVRDRTGGDAEVHMCNLRYGSVKYVRENKTRYAAGEVTEVTDVEIG